MKGETIEFDAVAQSGNQFHAAGSLKKQSYNGKTYWGFAMDSECPPDKVEGYFKPKKKTIRFKKEWSGHTFTQEEIDQLLEGKEISFEATSKAGKPYTAKGKLAEQTYNGTKYWGFKVNFN